MRKGTIKKYENFLADCRKETVILNIRQLAKFHSVSVTFTDWLVKNRYLVKMAGGSYKLIACPLGFNHIVNEYKNATESKQPPIKDFCNKVSEAYPHVTNTCQMSDKLTTEQREKAAIDILGTIMRDNQHITYDIIRNERKEIKTDLLKR